MFERTFCRGSCGMVRVATNAAPPWSPLIFILLLRIWYAGVTVWPQLHFGPVSEYWPNLTWHYSFGHSRKPEWCCLTPARYIHSVILRNRLEHLAWPLLWFKIPWVEGLKIGAPALVKLELDRETMSWWSNTSCWPKRTTLQRAHRYKTLLLGTTFGLELRCFENFTCVTSFIGLFRECTY